MAWYRAGTVTVANGSTIVTGSGTDFVANTTTGQAFLGPDGKIYEVVHVDASTQLTLTTPYLGASGAGQGYAVMPTQSFISDLAAGAATLLNTFGAVRDGIGQGLIPAGTIAAPGIRFSADQDTGVRRVGENALALVSGAVDALVAAGANVGIGTAAPAARLHVASNDQATARVRLQNTGAGGRSYDLIAGIANTGNVGLSVFDAANAVTRVVLDDGNGNMGVGTAAPAVRIHVASNDQATARVRLQNAGSGGRTYDLVAGVANVGNTGFSLFDATAGTTPLMVDAAGNLLVGATTAVTYHRINKAGAEGALVLVIGNGVTDGAIFSAAGAAGWSGAASAAYVGKNTTTGRSINAGGTINANGADYAEYMWKAPGCGTIAKGDVCGVDRDGLLTRTWSATVRPVVKSTDPNLVGGDSWARDHAPRPAEPIYRQPAYDGPAEPVKPIEPSAPTPLALPAPEQPVRGADETDDAFVMRLAQFMAETSAQAAAIAANGAETTAYGEAMAVFAAARLRWVEDDRAFGDAQARYDAAVAEAEQAHRAALTAFAAELASWEAGLEQLRVNVDRIAFCGQVPVNVDADTLAACEAALADGEAVYLVAVARGAGIGCQAVREGAMTLPLYMRRVGAVLAVRDGRPLVDVQHG